MVDRETISVAAKDFLKAVAEEAKKASEASSRWVQKSQWMVKTSETASRSQEFKRRILGRQPISFWFQGELLRSKAFLPQEHLKQLLEKAGVPSPDIPHGFLFRLFQHWLELPNPFAPDDRDISKIVKGFSEAVVSGRTTTKTRDAIVASPLVSILKTKAISFAEGISLRPITQEELWELGDLDEISRAYYPLDPFDMPSTEWAILEILLPCAIQTTKDNMLTRYSTRAAALSALVLASSGSLRFIPISDKQTYGIPSSMGLLPQGFRRRLSNWGGSYIVEAPTEERLKSAWPRIKEILLSSDHYLRLPAQRLLDGGGRDRPDDAIVDYIIGLEALLLSDSMDELRYKFSLRGATVLAWDDDRERKEFFKKCQKLYDIRSAIVHGVQGKRYLKEVVPHLEEYRSFGEEALRKVWWWFFDQKKPNIERATRMIDDRILL